MGLRGRALSVAKDVVFFGDLSMHSLSGHVTNFAFRWCRRRDGALASTGRPRSFLAVNESLMLRSHRSAGVHSWQPIVGDPELTMRQGHRGLCSPVVVEVIGNWCASTS